MAMGGIVLDEKTCAHCSLPFPSHSHPSLSLLSFLVGIYFCCMAIRVSVGVNGWVNTWSLYSTAAAVQYRCHYLLLAHRDNNTTDIYLNHM